MQQIKQLRLIVPALVLALSFVVSAPAFASEPAGGTSGGTGGGTTSGSGGNSAKPPTTTQTPPPSTSGGGSTETHHAPEDATKPATATPKSDGEHADEQGRADLHKKGKDKVAEMRKEKKTEVKQDDRQKRCEAHKKGSETKFAKIVANSQHSQARIDEIFTKAKAFQASKNLVPAGYGVLLATATNAQATSAAAISTLQAVQPTLDCTNPDVANDIATFKAAAEQTRNALQSYKAAVKNVLTSLKAAAKVTTETTTKPVTEGTH